MDVTPLIRANAQVIQSYTGGRFKISGQVYDGAVIVTPDEVRLWSAAPTDFSQFKVEDFAGIAGVDVVLLGTGKTMRILMAGLRQALKDAGLAVESMDTGAACRTYNVLMAEGRRVAAALLPFNQ